MAETLRIGMVDSGTRPEQRVAAARAFYFHHDALQTGTAQADILGHGSRLLAVIQSLAADAEICTAQVFFERLSTTPAQLSAALLWLMTQRVQLINLSLGLRRDHPILADACAQAIAQGIILCASTPTRGEPVWPAAYPGVLRVTGDARCQPGQFSWLNTPHADLGGCVRSADGSLAGASVGCAHLSGHIAGYLYRGGDPATLRDWLRSQAAYSGPERRRG